MGRTRRTQYFLNTVAYGEKIRSATVSRVMTMPTGICIERSATRAIALESA
jgi:hypothetical protein